jgi:hypothetical protein
LTRAALRSKPCTGHPEEVAVATFGIATGTTVDAVDTDAVPRLDTEDLRVQLEEIRDSLAPLISDSDRSLSLSAVELALTLSASGKVLFVGEAGVEASITLTFSRPEAG